MSKIIDMVKGMKETWKIKLVERKRDAYMKVFDEMEFKNDTEGLSRDEYDCFLLFFPKDYRRALVRRETFGRLAGKDGIIDFEEFRDFLDKIEQFLREIPETATDTIEEEEMQKLENLDDVYKGESKNNNTAQNEGPAKDTPTEMKTDAKTQDGDKNQENQNPPELLQVTQQHDE